MTRFLSKLTDLKIIIVLLLLAFIFAQFGGNQLPGVSKVQGATRTITLVGYVSPGWNSTTGGPTITVSKGDAVTMVLSSGDGHPHRFYVDVNANGMPDCPGQDQCSSTFSGSTQTSFQFTVDFPAGTYSYHCSIHGNMNGAFIVQAPPTPDFTLTATPSSIGPIGTSTQGTSTITIAPLNGFTGQVTLTTAPTTGLTATLNPTTINGGSGSSQLTVSATTSGSFTVTVTGVSGSISHAVTVPVSIGAGDFSLSISPATQTIAVGASGTFQVTLQSLNSFSGTVTITPSISPTSPTIAANPTSITLTPGGTGTSMVTVTTTAYSGLYSSPTQTGTYTVKVTANTGAISHMQTATESVGTQPSGNSNNPSPMSTPIDPLLLSGIVGAVLIAAVAGAGVYVLRRRPDK